MASKTAYPGPSYPKYNPVADTFVDVEKQSFGEDPADVAHAQMRLGFVRKVFGLLSAQLLITVAVAAPIVAHAGVKAFVTTNSWVLVLAMLSSFGILLALTFSESARHSHPTNLVLMGAFTVAEGVIVGAITSQYQMQAIVMAAGMTAMISVGLTLYALNTKKDFTMQASAAGLGPCVACLQAEVAWLLRYGSAHQLCGRLGVISHQHNTVMGQRPCSR
eukprot:GHUV01018510.1.p1 GENE.GHUV01018510.1~~GHUV01018510.1.p1  ORF type:complete len:219 (+),score=48.39 GHUV01018510.1:100-756(+)